MYGVSLSVLQNMMSMLILLYFQLICFLQVYNDVVPNSFRIINSKDLIPTVPKRYYHIGLEVIIDKVSPKKGGFIQDIFTATYDFCSGSNYHQHLTPAYFESISNAVKEYNLLISK